LTSITKSMVTIDNYIGPTMRQAWRLLRKKRCKSMAVGLRKFDKKLGEENCMLVKGGNIAKLGRKFLIVQLWDRLHKAAGDNKSINGNYIETSSAYSMEVSEIFRNCSNHSTRKKINSSKGNNEVQPEQKKLTFTTATSPVSGMATAASIARVSSFARSSLASSSRSTALNMVLSTPDTIIEQASTQKLLDTLIDESVRTSSREPVMLQFNPKRGWIWRQWRGTVFSETWKSGLLNMCLAISVVFLYRMYPGMKDLLEGFSILWGQLLSVTTFTLTFFLNQSYGLWRKCYDYSRRLQGRLNDLGMTLAAHATRMTSSSPDVPSTYTPQSRQALELVSRYVRVFNLLTYASFTRSHRPILTPRGMRRLVERGILTPKEREILTNAEVPATQRHNAVLVWLIRLFLEGRQTGVFEGGTGFEQQFMEKCHVIRAQYGAIGDELQGRMPLAYAHIVQVLVDVVLWMYPFMALSTGMAWHISIMGTFLLTMFYQGLFDLAKQFLDPYDNENYGKGDDPLVIDTLIAETNAGSVRWMNSFQQQPWSKQLLKDGELFDSLLPLRGYSTEELLEKEQWEESERRKKEHEAKEKKKRIEDEERKRAERLLMEHVASMENGTDSILEGGTVNGTAILVANGEVRKNSDGNMRLLKEEKPASLNVVGEDGQVIETTMHKVFMLEDGTVVTPDSIVTINNVTQSELNITSTDDTMEPSTQSDDMAEVSLLGLGSADIQQEYVTPVLDGSNEIAWDKIGAFTPTFEKSLEDVDVDGSNASKELSVKEKELLDEIDFAIEDDIFAPNVIEWFDEIDENGNEYRLSQMLADEEWSELADDDESNVSENETMTYEEFAKKATAIIEQAESELQETAEVMSASPGMEAEYDAKVRGEVNIGASASSATKRLPARQEPEQIYDQTHLDPISQLWGAGPEVLGRVILDDDDEKSQRILNENVDFANIYSLWGQPMPSKAPSSDDEEITAPSFEGIKQLWQDTPVSANGIKSSDLEEKPEPSYNFSAFGGIEWWDELTEDGKEYRLSMMLADEEYEEAMEPDEDKGPMTLEQFAKETAELIEQAEDERKETEAILNAPPNANFLEADEDLNEKAISAIEDSIAQSDELEKIIVSHSEQVDPDGVNSSEDFISDDDIEFLEMDDVNYDADQEKSIKMNYDAISTNYVDDSGNHPN